MTIDSLTWLNVWAFLPLSTLGALLHFAYEWSGRNRVVAIFSAVNESYWEHIKIAFWPVLVWFIGLYIAGGWNVAGFIPAATIALYSIPVTMIAVVFGYKAVVGRNILWIDILAFFLTVAVAQLIFVLVATELTASAWSIGLSTVFLLPLGVAFARYTLRPPKEPDLFIDPLNKRYGLEAHPEHPLNIDEDA